MYFRLDDRSNILEVTNKIPDDILKNITDADLKKKIKKVYKYQPELYIELPDQEYTETWDECKRCPKDKDGLPRYSFSNNAIIPNENVKNINFDDHEFYLNDKGVHTRLKDNPWHPANEQRIVDEQ